MLYALCGISRVGKTTILKQLVQREPRLERLVTTTTRAPRPEEVNHVDYHFVTVLHFQQALQAGHLVCPIVYRGKWYATTRDDLTACATKEVIAVLRPDKFPALSLLTPLLGIALSWFVQEHAVSSDDQIIVESQRYCPYHVVNIPGQLDQTVEQVLGIIHAHAGGKPWK